MTYTPFKMPGHELPGPNQRSALKYTPNVGNPQVDQFINDPLTTQSGNNLGLSNVTEAQNIQIARGVDTSSQLGVESTDISASTDAGGGTKKKVDVEVTVNGQPV